MGATGNEHGRVNMAEVDRVMITIVTDNYYDALRPETPVAKRFSARPGQSVHAEHGLSYYIETLSNGRTSALMFDYGLDARGVSNNLQVLGIDIGKADAFGLSHGHFDHCGAMVEILAMSPSRIREGTPLYLGEEVFERRYVLRPGTGELIDIGQLAKADLEALGLLEIKEVKTPTEVIPGGYFTGKIERITPYENPSPILLIQKGDALQIDTFPGEQAVAFNVKGKGLVVLSGCAHSGIINTVKHVQKMTGIEKVHAVLGGFHLVNAEPEIIERTVADMLAINPDYIVPTHCTGFEAIMAFSNEMPGRFILNTAGTKYTFGV